MPARSCSACEGCAETLRARGGWYVPLVMPTRPTPSRENTDDDALDLPPLDDAGDLETTEEANDLEDDLVLEVEGDAFDDATLGGSLEDLVEAGGIESGWLLDAEDAAGLEIGGVDLDVGDESETFGDDEPHGVVEDDPDLDTDEATSVGDGGEEGPLADDEELREEDLPMLDADDEGDVEDGALFEAGAIGGLEELLWDDRAWVRAPVPEGGDEDADDSGALPVPGMDPALAARDARWRALEEATRLTAAAFLPGGSVVVALPSPDGVRARLVRIPPEGDARIIGEVEPKSPEDDDACEVRGLRWDAERGVLVATGNFEPHAFRPA